MGTKEAQQQPADLINPLVDAANSRWFFFNSATRPSGMVNLSSDNAVNADWGAEKAQKHDFVSGKSHDKETEEHLSRVFINYGNQPCMQTAFLFNYAGAPWLTQYWTRQVVGKVYSGISPEYGYSGDEDQRQMGSLAIRFTRSAAPFLTKSPFTSTPVITKVKRSLSMPETTPPKTGTSSRPR